MARAARKWVTRQELAPMLDVTSRSIEKLIEDGMPVARRGRGRRPSLYDPEKCIAWKAARDAAAASPDGLDPAQERAAKDRAQRLLAEQMHAVRARKLLDADDVAKVWGQHIAAARGRLLAVPTTSADRLHRVATLEGVTGVERELQRVVEEVLRDLAGAPREEAAA